MLFERQRRLLTLLDAAGEPVSHTNFQKLLFLYTRECEVTPSYDFVSYKFGEFSFTSYADKCKVVMGSRSAFAGLPERYQIPCSMGNIESSSFREAWDVARTNETIPAPLE